MGVRGDVLFKPKTCKYYNLQFPVFKISFFYYYYFSPSL